MTKINNLNSSAIAGMGNRVWSALDLSLAQFRKLVFENIENWVEAKNNSKNYAPVAVENDRYLNGISVIYKLKEQYYHVVCNTYLEADHILQTILTDEKRIPAGIYNAVTNHFDWEIMGQYHFEVDPINKSVSDADERIKSIAEALRRRDASWIPGHYQSNSLFA